MGKTVALDWHAFMAGEVRPKQSAVVAIVPAVTAGVLATIGIEGLTIAQANMITNKMIHAFNPLISLMQGLSYPVSFLGMAAGMLLISVGQRHRGIAMIKWAGIGYIGMQLVPAMMSMVSQVGDSMK